MVLAFLSVSSAQFAKNGSHSEPKAGSFALASMAQADKPEGPALAVEDSLLFLSPGDRLKLRWWGIGAGSEDLIVNTRWEIVVPDLGVVRVKGIAFDKVRDSVERLVRSQIRIKMIDVQIVEIMRAQVQVTGLVPSPGIFDLPAGTRLSEALAKAGLNPRESMRNLAVGTPAQPGDRTLRPSLRRILLVRNGGKDSVRCDLAMAWNGGVLSQDPPLFAGDQIRIEPQGGVVALAGSVPNAGYLEYLPGETLGSFLRVAGAELSIQACDAVVAGKRTRLEASAVLDSTVELLELPTVRRRPLRPLVWIQGAVEKPGGYLLSEGMRVSDLLAQAGGPLGGPDSVVTMAVKRRWPEIQAGKRPGIEAVSQYPEVRLAVFSYYHQLKGNYSDPQALLQAGDTLQVNRAEHVVWVAGQVNRPGFVPWKKGATATDYVQAAGGYAPRAWEAKIQVFDLYTDQNVHEGGEIRPGSSVVVPEKRYLYADQWIALGATVIGAIVSVVSLSVVLGNQ